MSTNIPILFVTDATVSISGAEGGRKWGGFTWWFVWATIRITRRSKRGARVFGQGNLSYTLGVFFVVKPLRNTPIFRFSGNSVFCSISTHVVVAKK